MSDDDFEDFEFDLNQINELEQRFMSPANNQKPGKILPETTNTTRYSNHTTEQKSNTLERQTKLYEFTNKFTGIENLKLNKQYSSVSQASKPIETKSVVFTPSNHEVDEDGLKTWVYPTNYAERTYQLNIVQVCLFQNTLVCLPTGLGKTFIAAVVIFNFYRWFKNGKIIFMAPTRPLVNQQIDACLNVTGIPEVFLINLECNRRTYWISYCRK
jgi:hypothetical protein